MAHPDDFGSGPCACFTLGGTCERCAAKPKKHNDVSTLHTTPHVARLTAVAREAELALRRQLYKENETAIAMLKLQSEAEAAVVVHGLGHPRALEAEHAWEAQGATMQAELEDGERTLHATHGHLLAAAIATLRLRTAN